MAFFSRTHRVTYCSIFIPLCTTAALVMLYIREHNYLTELRIAVPRLEREISSLEAKKKTLEFELEQFFSPAHLEEICRRAQYAHFKQIEPHDIAHLEPYLYSDDHVP